MTKLDTFIDYSKVGEWVSDSAFCPFCGNQGVVTQNGVGDYHAGDAYVCFVCPAVFHLPYSRITNFEDPMVEEAMKAVTK